ncbi:MAG: hypothetical protein H6574_16510 [Lewinellaceae bacterium]|nr:hypothetical protein [Lewinellaceae bacterium]
MIFDKLLSSGIRCIHRYGEDKHYPIKLNNPFSERSLYLKWANLQFAELHRAVQSQEYSFGQIGLAPEPLRDALLDGYVLYKMHYFDLAYAVFLKVEEESKRAEDFALYFICLRNRIRAGREIYWRGNLGQYSQSFADQIKEEIEKANLNEVLLTIKVEKPVQELLWDIHQEKVVKFFSREVEDNFLSILKIYTQYQNIYSEAIGPNYAIQLEQAFENLCWFYDSNGLVTMDNRAFEKAAEQTFEGLVASFQTSQRYNERYTEYNCRVLRYCLQWLQPQNLTTILNKYALERFSFSNGHKELFVNWAINLFKSSYSENSFPSGTKENKDYQSYLEINSIYQIPEKKLIPNFLITLAYVDLEDNKELSGQLYDTILKGLYWLPVRLFRLNDFILFFYKHVKFFSPSQIESLFELLHSWREFRRHHVENLVHGIRETQPDLRISDQTLFDKLLVVKDGRFDPIQLAALIELFEFLDTPLQTQLTQAVEKNFNTAFDLDLFFDAYIAGCIPKAPFPKAALNSLKNTFEKVSGIRFTSDGSDLEPFDANTPFRGGETPHKFAWQVLQLARIRYLHYFDRKTLSWFLKQPDLPESLRWLLKPKVYDYTKFDHRWLYFITEDDAMVKKLADQKIDALKQAIQKGLAEQYSERLAGVYFKYFID